MLNRIQSYQCPCCGNYLGEAAPLDLVRDAISHGHQRTIFDELAKKQGVPVHKEKLLSVMYGSVGGGPDTSDQVAATMISALKKKLERYGWTIHSAGGGRGNVSRYRLIPLEAGA